VNLDFLGLFLARQLEIFAVAGTVSAECRSAFAVSASSRSRSRDGESAPGAGVRGPDAPAGGHLAGREIQVHAAARAEAGRCVEQRVAGAKLLAHDDDLVPLPAAREVGAERLCLLTESILVAPHEQISSSLSCRSSRPGSRSSAFLIRSEA
jgi:hypothetical protein